VPKPKSQTAAEIPNYCRNPKPLIGQFVSRDVTQIQRKFCFPSKMEIELHKFSKKEILCRSFNSSQNYIEISATVWDFGNSLGFRQQFGISEKCRNYISAYVKSQTYFGTHRFRHPSLI